MMIAVKFPFHPAEWSDDVSEMLLHQAELFLIFDFSFQGIGEQQWGGVEGGSQQQEQYQAAISLGASDHQHSLLLATLFSLQ